MAAHRKRQLPEDTAQICQAAFGYRPRAEQIQVVEMLGRMKDCILIAGTGWGKTLVYFLPLLIWPNDIILIVSPLKVLSDEQHSKLVALGIPSINIKQETRTNIADLASGKYRAVFTSPEIIFKSSRLSALWQDKGWRSRLRNIVVDEAHCVGTWGMDFRQAYSQLGRLRAMAHPDVSFLAVSATLPPALLTTLTSSMLFKNATVVNVGNDRINIKYTVSIMKHGRSTFHDLFFLKDKVKTIVYFQTLMEVESAAVYVKALVGVNSVAIFHAAKSELYKRNKMEDFKQNRVCILLSTEAAGMGCDISDVIRVVQYGYPGSISVLFQRLGRAGRNPALQGISIFLVPSQAPSLVDPFLRDYVTISSCRRRYVNECLPLACHLPR
ncbi:P-loop containing nucleoside triphosphate hydrolase protein [Gamsiella multidivaricata]|uniref:P-loop containing nucleoside triphosphate hydrolase protein n=1 Tax=Gamsiella multidivaricata TaxID=101098 RepID=UPI00221FF357|nr:P-loop containing nucleoside triphosphate hydrolase protein [Gamsiella multidivaricata]XP_051408787.1 P-loop containing nucleoside triphosphate hydrolase protein [Gamsiella multidivaricata]KAI7818767.1 P-loop containing nucleoside triphosphate hydrolase protein [Gamsiella multidivaricata]KAI7818827.1 P-loop containing nucleoside triphosphate hydrolase protein [Gamsiella multidivaricata]